jgi:chitinase
MTALLVLGSGATAQDSTMPEHDYRVVGYYAAWTVYRDFSVADIPADQLTHINYAFANISANGEIALGDPWADVQMPDENDTTEAELQGNFRQLLLLKLQYPHLKTLISVGGWSWSARFSDVALTPEKRERFARSAVAFITTYGFDGVDLDWEYPTGGGDPGNATRPEDPENFILLLEEIRSQLDAQSAIDNRPYLLTIANGAGRSTYQPLDWQRIHPLLDWINVMTYDMAGPWSSVTGFNAPLYDSQERPPEGTSTDTAMMDYVALGIPPEKLIVGVPFYGRGWANVADVNNGLHQPYEGLAPGTREAGSYDYADLAANHVTPETRFWNETAQVPWLYNPDTGIMITYDDPESLAAKASYVREHGLGGIMIWELSTDDGSLLSSIDTTLSAE